MRSGPWVPARVQGWRWTFEITEPYVDVEACPFVAMFGEFQQGASQNLACCILMRCSRGPHPLDVVNKMYTSAQVQETPCAVDV